MRRDSASRNVRRNAKAFDQRQHSPFALIDKPRLAIKKLILQIAQVFKRRDVSRIPVRPYNYQVALKARMGAELKIVPHLSKNGSKVIVSDMSDKTSNLLRRCPLIKFAVMPYRPPKRNQERFRQRL